jgi:hypothetical protein
MYIIICNTCNSIVWVDTCKTEFPFRCDLNGDGQLDYTEFTKYLLAHGVSEGEGEPGNPPLLSTNTATYSNRTEVY